MLSEGQKRAFAHMEPGLPLDRDRCRHDATHMQFANTYGQTVAQASVDERASFLTKTYLHLVGAIFVFVGMEALLIVSGLAEKIAIALSGRFAWFLLLGAFMGVSYVADRWARSDSSVGMQYAGLALYTFAEAIIFAPLIVMAMYASVEYGGGSMDILAKAGGVTVLLFGVLSAVVFVTRKDFSFMRSFLMFGGIAAMVLIVASLIFGFQLGIIFVWFMIVFASGSILYNTSNVMIHYRPTQHVAAALTLFASFALLLYYVIILFMRRD